ncbi:hypothetical protein ACE103_10480 [Bradyrhizobium sp. ma5]|uniref:hypothetical protein n=1 Tax=Bradyrhizobium sp. ma5 TaxID=3344828 RepID=UPI0035D49607
MARTPPEAQQMGGWIVTVAIFKEDSDDEEFRHVTYAVAVANPKEAVKLTLKDSGAKAAMLNGPIEEQQLQRLGVEPGELIVVHDDEIDPIISRPRPH